MIEGLMFLKQGGNVMYLLLLCSIFVVSIAIERAIYFKGNDDGREFSKNFYLYILKGDYKLAKDLLQSNNGQIAQIIRSAISFKDMQKEDLSNYLQAQASISLANFKKRLYYLNVIVTIAPLLGLLGTIIGMISAFNIFNVQSSQAGLITSDVGEALIATATGLCVAIISLIIHSYYIQRIDNIVTDMEKCFSLVEVSYEKLKDGDLNATSK